MDGSFQSSLVGTLEILRQTRRYAGVFDNTLGQFAGKKKMQSSTGGAGGRGVINAWRIAQGSQSAVFKKIPKGGAHTTKQLRAQVDYLFSKASVVFGNMVDHEPGRDGFLPEAREAMVSQWSSNWRFAPARGQTSHLLLSFPADVNADAALKIATTWAAEMLQSKMYCDDEWAYVAALHTDRPHPHIHIVLNNRGLENDTWFYMAKDHVFEANAMRERLVEISREFGVYLDSSSRLERGIVSYGLSRAEREIASREGRTTLERKRHGDALDAALARIEETQKIIQLFGDMAALVGDSSVQQKMQEAAKKLDSGDILIPEKGIAMADQHTDTPIDLKEYFSGWVGKAEEVLSDLASDEQDERRAEITRITNSVASALKGEAAVVLSEMMPTSALYSTRIENDRIITLGKTAASEVLISSEASRKLMARLKFLAGEIGIEATDISERLRRGANTALKERSWMQRDLEAAANVNGFDLDTEDHRNAASEIVEAFYARAAAVIAQARDHGLGADDEQLSRVLRKVANIAEEHGQVEFASARDVEGFVEDIEERYGSDVAQRVAAGDRSALLDDFPESEECRDIAIGILSVAKDHAFGGITRAQAIDAIVELKLELDLGNTFEQGFDDGFEL